MTPFLLTQSELFEFALAAAGCPSWTAGEGSLYLRTLSRVCEHVDEEGTAFQATEDVAAYGVSFDEREDGRIAATVVAVEDTASEEDLAIFREHFASYISTHTSYGWRLAQRSFLCETLGLDEESADAVSSALQSLSPGTTQGDRFPERSDDVGTFFLQSGGYVKLRLLGDVLHVACSIPNANYPGTYGPLLQGTIRPAHGYTTNAAACIAGWEMDTLKSES